MLHFKDLAASGKNIGLVNVFSLGRIRSLRYLRARMLHFKDLAASGKNIRLMEWVCVQP